jgi:hypothetical protein
LHSPNSVESGFAELADGFNTGPEEFCLVGDPEINKLDSDIDKFNFRE